MSESPLPRRLHIKPAYRVLVLHSPPGYIERLVPLPPEATLDERSSGQYDLVHLFVSSKADLDTRLPTALRALRPKGLLWISYPKRSSGIRTDITRDIGWGNVERAGWKAVAQISVDDTWSALRFKPIADVPQRRQRP